MSIDERFRIDGVQGTNPAQSGEQAKPGDPTEFRRLLERLEDVARKSNEPDQVEDVEKLRDAMKKADDDFSVVMDLRKQLEEAYRRSQP